MTQDHLPEPAPKPPRRQQEPRQPTPGPQPPNQGAPRTAGWVVGRLAGAPVIITPTWFVSAVVLTVLFAPTVRRQAPDLSSTSVYVVALAFVLLLFASVFLHEVAHALMARARGHQVSELALTLWGGHTAYNGGSERPLDAFLVAVVGPITNLVLAAGFWGLFHASDPYSVPALLLYAAAFSNAFVGGFNLLPGLPLDGGQILESAVWAATGRRDRAIVAAGWVGRVVAIGLVAWALGLPLLHGEKLDLTTTVWTVLIAAFLWSGATQGIRQGQARTALSKLAVVTLMTPAHTVPVNATVEDARRQAVATAAMVVVDHTGLAVAVVDPDALVSVPVEQAPFTPLSAASIPLPPDAWVPVGTQGADVVDAIASRGNQSPVLVVVDGTRVVGVLSVAVVVQAFRQATGR